MEKVTKLYNHIIKDNHIEIKEFPVRETEKAYFVLCNAEMSGTFLSRIRKSDIGKIYDILGGYFVLYNVPQKEAFLEQIFNLYQEQARKYQKILEDCWSKVRLIEAERKEMMR